MNKFASFVIDIEELKKAKKNGINISKLCRDSIKAENMKHEQNQVNDKYLDLKLVQYFKNTSLISYNYSVTPDIDVLKRIASAIGTTWQEVDKVWMDKKRIKTLIELSKMP